MGKGKVVIAKINIKRIITKKGDTIWVNAVDEAGEELALVNALGMLRFAEDALIHDYAEKHADKDDEGYDAID